MVPDAVRRVRTRSSHFQVCAIASIRIFFCLFHCVEPFKFGQGNLNLLFDAPLKQTMLQKSMCTPQLSVQKYLREWQNPGTDSALISLKSSLGVSHLRHPKYRNLVLLKYNQIASPMGDDVVQDCRGLILDEGNNWCVVAMAFRKFFNLGEPHAAEIDWSTATVQEKVDGSLCVLYAYDSEWHVATTGSPDASGRIPRRDASGRSFDASSTTFANYFWDTFRSSGMTLPPVDCGVCFFFELTGPMNHVVVVHAAPQLTVLGCRRLPSLQEAPAADAAALLGRTVAAVAAFPLRSADEVRRALERLRPSKQEGFVVADGAWRRVKIKHPGYVAIHHCLAARGTPVRQRAIAKLVQRGEAGEALAALPPDLRPAVEAAAARYAQLADALAADAARLAGVADQRAFAAAAVGTRWAHALFRMRAGRCAGARAALAEMKTDDFARLLGLDPHAPAAWDSEPAVSESDRGGLGPNAGPGPAVTAQEAALPPGQVLESKSEAGPGPGPEAK